MTRAFALIAGRAGVAVRYFSAYEGGVSNFNYLRNNTLFTWMHIRQMCGFVLCLPLLIWQRLVRP